MWWKCYLSCDHQLYKYVQNSLHKNDHKFGKLKNFNITFSYPDLARIDTPEGVLQIGEQIYFFFVPYTLKNAFKLHIKMYPN
jgi:hypothetical protein